MKIVNEHYRFVYTGTSAVRIVDASGVAPAGLFAIGTVAAYGQIGTRSQHGGTTTVVVDDKREGLVDAVIGFVKPLRSFA